MGYVRKPSAEIRSGDESVLYSESEGKATVISTSSTRTHASMPGQFLPFGKRPIGNRPLPALSKKPDYIFLVGREDSRLLLRRPEHTLSAKDMF